jgi:hypothetical protein
MRWLYQKPICYSASRYRVQVGTDFSALNLTRWAAVQSGAAERKDMSRTSCGENRLYRDLAQSEFRVIVGRQQLFVKQILKIS